jgi:hypothetical protein
LIILRHVYRSVGSLKLFVDLLQLLQGLGVDVVLDFGVSIAADLVGIYQNLLLVE